MWIYPFRVASRFIYYDPRVSIVRMLTREMEVLYFLKV